MLRKSQASRRSYLGRTKTPQAGLCNLSLVAECEIHLPADEQNRFEQAMFARAGQQQSSAT